MRRVIFKHFIIELGAYLFIPKMVLHCVLWSKEKYAVTLSNSAQRKHAFLGEIKEMPKTKKLPCRKKIAL